MNNLIVRLIRSNLNRFVEIRVSRELRRLYSQIWETAKQNGEKKVLKFLPNGSKFYCYTDSIVSEKIFSETFENEELDFIAKFLRPDEQFVDIGAHSGLFTIHGAKIVGSKGSIISFEPTPETHKRLVENIKLNNLENVKAFSKAISAQNGCLDFYTIKDGFEAWNSLAPPPKSKSFEKITVETIQIDRIAEMELDFEKSALIKIDVEGWELELLKGGKKLFEMKNAPSLMVEFTDENVTNAGTTCKELYQYLSHLGYKLFTYNKRKGKLKSAPIKDYYPYENIIATKNLKFIQKRLASKR